MSGSARGWLAPTQLVRAKAALRRGAGRVLHGEGCLAAGVEREAALLPCRLVSWADRVVWASVRAQPWSSRATISTRAARIWTPSSRQLVGGRRSAVSAAGVAGCCCVTSFSRSADVERNGPVTGVFVQCVRCKNGGAQRRYTSAQHSKFPIHSCRPPGLWLELLRVAICVSMFSLLYRLLS